MTTLQQIKKLKWVKAAYSLGGATYVTTKPGMLKTVLSHSLEDTGYGNYGQPLGTPIVVTLPAYRIRLLAYTFDLALVKKPRGGASVPGVNDVVFPCVNDPRAYSMGIVGDEIVMPDKPRYMAPPIPNGVAGQNIVRRANIVLTGLTGA